MDKIIQYGAFGTYELEKLSVNGHEFYRFRQGKLGVDMERGEVEKLIQNLRLIIMTNEDLEDCVKS